MGFVNQLTSIAGGGGVTGALPNVGQRTSRRQTPTNFGGLFGAFAGLGPLLHRLQDATRSQGAGSRSIGQAMQSGIQQVGTPPIIRTANQQPQDRGFQQVNPTFFSPFMPKGRPPPQREQRQISFFNRGIR